MGSKRSLANAALSGGAIGSMFADAEAEEVMGRIANKISKHREVDMQFTVGLVLISRLS